jgi:hypothetical protein
MGFVANSLSKVAKEPPFRLILKALYTVFPASVETRSLWDVSPRPNYLLGVLRAAREAREFQVPEISVIEFGVAGGNGLLALQKEAAAVEAATGVSIKVYGFDNGSAGLPDFIGDHRDHPDAWAPGDYAMDEAALRSRLDPRTTLVLGDVKDTVPAFVADSRNPPVGFISIDVDLYSSTSNALKVLSLPGKRMLRRVAMYFDDMSMFINHGKAGEFLAIEDFNAENNGVFIDRWMGVKVDRPFPEKSYLDVMYVAHDLDAISSTVLKRPPLDLSLRVGTARAGGV